MTSQQAKEATPPGQSRQCLLLYEKEIQDPLMQRKRTAAVYSKHSEARDRQEVTTRKDATLLAQLRSAHSILLQAYKHLPLSTFTVFWGKSVALQRCSL